MLPVTTPPRIDLPPGSTDCHLHVFDPARFSFDMSRSYTPPAATATDLIEFQQKMRMHRVVLVQPSCYGFDNAAMLDAIAQLSPAKARGIAVLDFERNDATMLHGLHASGVRGVRLNFATQKQTRWGNVREQLAKAHRVIAPLGWSLQLHCQSDLIAELLPELSRFECTLVLDHFAGLRAKDWDPRGSDWAAIRTLLNLGRTYIKLSAPYRISDDARVPGVERLAGALVSAAPERMLWGSDWPHTGGSGVRETSSQEIEPFRHVDAGTTLDLLADWAPTPELRHRILVTNPAAVFGFDPLPATAA
ncbi:amidohydrolase family protein [Variovorax fucosicus]|uniref:amidohydrolase family protein n=1 Tax=Variovorax fucosicus TaxID=3053517 RepID=UPI002578DEFA|nr:amidohydrolase family protein [Variovorax sp. J22G47]MDM0058872.1 amidohydrolase family protein [Variovorax sp. J22G47]